MIRRKSICSLPLLLLALCVFGSCSASRQGPERPRVQAEKEQKPQGRFDPFEMPADREIVPEKYPKSGAISGHSEIVMETRALDPAPGISIGVPTAFDSTNNQVFRVQLFAGKQFGEAKQSLRVAEEIFDRPVYLDYEVPYYKVRVGSFVSRREAEEYQLRAQAAGYRNSWVVVSFVKINRAAPLYEIESEWEPLDSTEIEDNLQNE